MTAPTSKRGYLVFWGALLLLGTGLALSSGPIRALLAEAMRTVSLASVLATVPGQIAASVLCAAALWALKPGPGLWGCLKSRLLRDAGDNLLVFLPGLGEVIGARALVLAGGKTRAAVTASALDKLAETLAQVPYIALAAWVLFAGWQSNMADRLPGWQVGLGLLAVLALIGGGLLWARHGTSRWAIWLRAEWAHLREEYHRQKSGLPLCTALHFLAWVMGGVQIWMAASALGLELTLYEAIAIESAAYAGRAILFFVPAGLVTQEAGIVAAGLLFGLTPAESLAIALVLRLRDLLFGVVLLAWPIHEWRHGRRIKAGG